MVPSGIITFTTDFGLRDSYVGQMKGAALSVAPDARLVDLCHEVPPQQVAAGAYVLETGYGVFPAGTVHVAVVDPGVGTGRGAVAVRAGDQFFVAPDNGLLTRVLRREPLHEAHLLTDAAFQRPERSATFDGRDLFAPAAAWVARGTELRRLGPPAAELVRLEGVRPEIRLGKATPVPVVWVDRFGNVTLDVHRETLRKLLGPEPWSGAPLRLVAGDREVRAFHRTFADAEHGAPFLLVNSSGYLEVALREARADHALGLEPGSNALLTIEPPGQPA